MLSSQLISDVNEYKKLQGGVFRRKLDAIRIDIDYGGEDDNWELVFPRIVEVIKWFVVNKGYSVNDTIVIFDRIRENMQGMLKKDEQAYADMANESISQTLSRSISTSITTAIMVLMLLILGVSTIREFALPLLVGVVTGTYSSICLATELWFVMKTKIGAKKK